MQPLCTPLALVGSGGAFLAPSRWPSAGAYVCGRVCAECVSGMLQPDQRDHPRFHYEHRQREPHTLMQPLCAPLALVGTGGAFKAVQCLSLLVAACAQEAFSRCSSLTSVTIPDSVTSIGDVSLTP